MKSILFIALAIPMVAFGQEIYSQDDLKAAYDEDQRFGVLVSQGNPKAGYSEEKKKGELYSEGDTKALYHEETQHGNLVSNGDKKAGYNEKLQVGGLASKGDLKASYDEKNKRTCMYDGGVMVCFFRGNETWIDGTVKSGLFKSMDQGKTWKQLN